MRRSRFVFLYHLEWRYQLTTFLDYMSQLESFATFFDIVERSLGAATKKQVVELHRRIFTMFMDAFDVSFTPSDSDRATDDGQELVSKAYIAFVFKLSEVTFTPLFRKWQDWAWSEVDVSSGKPSSAYACSDNNDS